MTSLLHISIYIEEAWSICLAIAEKVTQGRRDLRL